MYIFLLLIIIISIDILSNYNTMAIVMYITRVRTKTKKGKVSHTCILLRESYRQDGKVKNRTLLNLTNYNPKVIEAIELAIKNPEDILSKHGDSDSIKITLQKSVGASYCVFQMCKDLGITKALGNTHDGKLALLQIISRVIGQGSRLSAVRTANENSLPEILGLTKSINDSPVKTP